MKLASQIRNETVAKVETMRARETQWRFRQYTGRDTFMVVRIFNAAYVADGIDWAMSYEDVLMMVRSSDAESPLQIVIAEDLRAGTPTEDIDTAAIAVGTMRLCRDRNANEYVYSIGLAIPAEVRGTGLEQALMKDMLGRVRAAEARLSAENAPGAHKVRVRMMAQEGQDWKLRLCQEIGLAHERNFWEMERPLNEPIEHPASVKGVTIRKYNRPYDNIATLEAANSAFADHFDFQPMSTTLWEESMNSSQTRPEMSWVAEAHAELGKIAALCIAAVNDGANRTSGRSEGWIAPLCTRREWRNRGLGRALLLLTLQSFKEEGMAYGVLQVDSQNLTGATRLYESVGFRVRKLGMQYGCELKAAKI
jgi:ribosomal protein S18 acetylase RimI-like enzyme